MSFSSVYLGVLFSAFLSISAFLAPVGVADEVLSDISSDKNSDAANIDWSKPAVSRGFGLEASQGDVNQQAVIQYQSGQVFYFFGEYKKAVKKWLPLVEQNFPEAQASMGWLYQAGLGVEKDEKKAFQLYQQAAEQNNAVAQNNLGVMYENGIAVRKNIEKAKYWYQRSANQGYRFAQFNLANILLLNKDGVQDAEQAKSLLQQAAAQGVQQAKEKLNSL